jgi:hypothetical protein
MGMTARVGGFCLVGSDEEAPEDVFFWQATVERINEVIKTKRTGFLLFNAQRISTPLIRVKAP